MGYSTGGKPPTGYRNTKILTGRIKASGEPEMHTAWEPDPILASKVKLAFEMCTQGKTNVSIVESTKIVSAKNGLSTLLRNRAYLGERIYNTTRRVSLSEKKTHRLKNSPDEFIIITDAHQPIVDKELFDRVQAIMDSKRPKMGRRKNSPHEYILSGLLWCKEHDTPYTGHTNGERLYYACAMRKKLGKKLSPCPWLKKDAIEKFILDNLKENIITRDIIRQGLEYIQLEESRNRHEDDTEKIEVEKLIKQANLELTRCYAAIKSGVHAEAMATPINELHERINRLNNRLAEVEKEREKALKLPAITDVMVDDILNKVRAMLDTTDRKELKAALTHFIERIEIHGQDVTIEYTFKKPTTAKVPVTGDPGGI
jgi:site-specific DNA recombinase